MNLSLRERFIIIFNIKGTNKLVCIQPILNQYGYRDFDQSKPEQFDRIKIK